MVRRRHQASHHVGIEGAELAVDDPPKQGRVPIALPADVGPRRGWRQGHLCPIVADRNTPNHRVDETPALFDLQYPLYRSRPPRAKPLDGPDPVCRFVTGALVAAGIPWTPLGKGGGVRDEAPDGLGVGPGRAFRLDVQLRHGSSLSASTVAVWLVLYQMVHLTVAASQARDRLLAAAVQQASAGGIADLSLRELASAIGTSHRMLIYHFGSREGLLIAVTQAVEVRERAAFLDSGVTPDDAWVSWQRLSDPKIWPQERLFFELYSYALLGRPGTEQFLTGIVEAWVTPIAAALVQMGVDPEVARTDARLGVAVARGLLLDLLATGDRDGAGAAYQRFIRLMTHSRTAADDLRSDPEVPGLAPM